MYYNLSFSLFLHCVKIFFLLKGAAFLFFADGDLPFKAHGSVKTSSPIEGNKVVEGEKKLANEQDRAMSPILFACEDYGKEEAKTEPLPSQKCNGYVTMQNIIISAFHTGNNLLEINS